MGSTDKNSILIVGNDPLNIFILKEMLVSSFSVISASASEEASHLAESYHPDLILIDLMMRDTNGYDICRSLRANPKIGGFTKIILISTRALIKDRLHGYEVGADDYIARPFDREELMAKVRVFLRLKHVEEIDRVKDDLINVFSHETRTPLNAIIGFSTLLQESSSLSSEEKEFARLIMESGNRLLALSEKAVLLTSLRKENYPSSMSEFSLSPLIANALQTVAASYAGKKMNVELEVSDQHVTIDPLLILKVLIYIIDNAYRFSPDGAKLKIVSELTSSVFRLRFSDSGCGISPDCLSKVFDEFAVGSIAHHGNGHGLSLAVARMIMSLHGGSISAENNMDAPGATFTIEFKR